MATLRKRGSGSGFKWHVQVRRSGQSQTRSFTHKADAEAWGRKIERDIDTGEIRALSDQLKAITVGELLIRYRDEVMSLKRGAIAEAYIIDRFLRHTLANATLVSVNGKHISEYRDERLKTVKGGTIHRELAVLRHCFEVARKDWDIPLKSNPVHGITMPSVGKPRERRVSEAELSSLHCACSHPLLWQVITIALETSQRRSEIVNMSWEDIDWEVGTLHIPVTKNGHPRTIPLTEKALETLRELQCYSGTSDRVFPMTGNAVRLAWVRLKKKAGVHDLRFHDLRHEAISRMFDEGMTVPEVAAISGHRTVSMLFRYAHVANSVIKQ